jgi:Fe-S oxidoreductase/nitrate reductase gamma subunit
MLNTPLAARIIVSQAEAAHAAPAHEIPLIFYLFATASIGYLTFNLRKLTAVKIGTSYEGNYAPATQLFQALFFGVAQRKVFRQRFSYASVMHFLMGWGFIELFYATTVDFFTARGVFLNYLPGMDEPWFAALNDLGGIMLLVGVLMALYRRHANKPEPLPQDTFKGRGNLFGDTGILIFLVVIAVGGFFAEAARLAVDAPATASASWLGYPLSQALPKATWVTLKPFMWWSHALISLLFIAVLPLTKMFHAIAVIVNVTLTNRKRRGALSVMKVSEMMEDPDLDYENVSFGAATVKDLSWKSLLDSVACTECARCTSVCPAYATGKPLSPMRIITKIRHSLYETKFGDAEEAAPLVGDLITEDELWSCTTCGACMEECPVLINHIPTFTELRRNLTLAQGAPPTQAAKSLESTAHAGNPWGIPAERRLEWTENAGVEVPVMADKKEADVLFWVGCAGAFDPRNQKIAQSVARVMDKAGVDFAVLGTEETCTGDSARRMGDEYTFEVMAQQNMATFEQYKFNKIVTACPHCLHTLGNEYKDLGGDYDVVHHSQFLDQLVTDGKVSPKEKSDDKVVFHDPCYLGRHNKEYEAPRSILKQIVNNNVEVEQSKDKSFCCGAGGGNMWYEIDEGERINVTRFNQLAEAEPDTVATGCSFCMIMMDDAVKVAGKEEQIKIKDVAELLDESL